MWTWLLRVLEPPDAYILLVTYYCHGYEKIEWEVIKENNEEEGFILGQIVKVVAKNNI